MNAYNGHNNLKRVGNNIDSQVIIIIVFILIKLPISRYQQMVDYSSQPQPANWCKFQSVDDTSFIIVSSVIVAQCTLFCLFLRQLTIRVHHKVKISPDESFLFRLIGVWFTIAFIKSILNVAVYAVYETDQGYVNNQGQIALSAICLFFDKMSSFSLHTILMKIPTIWIKNTVLRLQNQQLTLQDMKRVDRVFKTLSIIAIYLKVRLIAIAINFAFDIYFVIDPNFGQYSKYLTSITMFQAIVAIFIYTFGMRSLHRFQDMLHFPRQLLFKVKMQYGLLLFCCITRLIFNFMYYFRFAIHSYDPAGNCLDIGHHSRIANYIYLSLGYATMHILPIMTIIMVYWPDIKDNTVRRSIFSVSDFQFLKKKFSDLKHCHLLGSQQIYDESCNEEDSQKSNRQSQVRVFYDK